MTQQDVIARLNDLDYLCAEFIHAWNNEGDTRQLLAPVHLRAFDHSNQIPDLIWIMEAKGIIDALKAHEQDDQNGELIYVQIASKPGKKGPKASPGS